MPEPKLWGAKPVKNEENAGQTPSESQENVQPQSLLVVKVPTGIALEDMQHLSRYMEPVGKKLGAEVVICPDGMDAQWHQDLSPLIAVIASQTEAITRLAMSNEALVEAMGQEDPDMLGLPVSTYMDGSPVR